jgi:hypothetical protein
MRATTMMLSLTSLLLTGAFSISLTQPAQPAGAQPVPWHPCAQIRSACTRAFCSQRRQDGCWDSVGLYPADYGRDATTEAGQQAFATTRPSGRGGMQGAKSRFRNGWRATLILRDSTVENSTRDGPSLGRTRGPYEIWSIRQVSVSSTDPGRREARRSRLIRGF